MKRRRKQLRRNPVVLIRLTFGIIAILVLLAIFAFVFRNALWNASANFLIAPDSPEKADLIFLLGGDYMLRAPFAAQLYKEGYSPKILIAHEPVYNSNGRFVDFTGDTVRTLERDGVPKHAIVEFRVANGVTSTADEARALRIYVDAYPVKSILVVTSMLHSRRARMAIRRSLAGREIRVRVACVGPGRYTPAQRAQVKQEMLKTVYYFVTFWG